ncbi:MAG TPA: SsrA-binding protein SmpB [Chitinophagaceae bacterium]|nr:SsrA-binding protein SmpB [Chitinophagaceae bacterium]
MDIFNRSATYEYAVSEKFVAGLVLTGTEIKSLRQGKASFTDAFCYFVKGELFLRNLHIAEYSHGNITNHDPLRERKLLLHKRELHKLETRTREKGFTIIPLKLFINQAGFAKLEIALAKGKKIHDKRQSIRERETDREIRRRIE